MQPVIDRLTVSDLHNHDVRKRINASSTLYFPPKEFQPLNDFGHELLALGKTTKEQLEHAVFPQLPIYQLVGKSSIPGAYTEYAKKAIAALTSRTISPQYQAYCASPAMQKAVEQISLSLDTLETYLHSPVSFAESISGLKDAERTALASGDFLQIDTVMKSESLDVVSSCTTPDCRFPMILTTVHRESVYEPTPPITALPYRLEEGKVLLRIMESFGHVC